MQPEEYIDISRIAILLLTLDLGKKGYISTASNAGERDLSWNV